MKRVDFSRREFLATGAAAIAAAGLVDIAGASVTHLRLPDSVRYLMEMGWLGDVEYVQLTLPEGERRSEAIAAQVASVVQVLDLGDPEKVAAVGGDVTGSDFPDEFMLTARYGAGAQIVLTTLGKSDPWCVVHGAIGSAFVRADDTVDYREKDSEKVKGRMYRVESPVALSRASLGRGVDIAMAAHDSLRSAKRMTA